MYGLEILLLLGGLLIAVIAQIYVSSSFAKYKKVQNDRKISGFEVAKEILENNGLGDIYITETKGVLSDHYDPTRKVVRLSTDIFHGTTIASASVAAHEASHAVQDKVGYSFMRIRAAIFPLVKFASYAGYFAILIGVLAEVLELIWLGIAMEIIILLFQLVTLPVEFDASKRAKEELKKHKMLTEKELDGSDKMLKAAAYTYVASVVTTLLQIIRLVLIYGNRKR